MPHKTSFLVQSLLKVKSVLLVVFHDTCNPNNFVIFLFMKLSMTSAEVQPNKIFFMPTRHHHTLHLYETVPQNLSTHLNQQSTDYNGIYYLWFDFLFTNCSVSSLLWFDSTCCIYAFWWNTCSQKGLCIIKGNLIVLSVAPFFN